MSRHIDAVGNRKKIMPRARALNLAGSGFNCLCADRPRPSSAPGLSPPQRSGLPGVKSCHDPRSVPVYKEWRSWLQRAGCRSLERTGSTGTQGETTT